MRLADTLVDGPRVRDGHVVHPEGRPAVARHRRRLGGTIGTALEADPREIGIEQHHRAPVGDRPPGGAEVGEA
jgi:hypothetical protein